MLRIAVICYSLTGNTRQAAGRVARAAGAEYFEIRDARPRRGPIAALRSVWEVLTGRSSDIVPPSVNPAAFDALVLACPVWAARPASPMQAWLTQIGEISRPVGLLLTLGGSGADHAFAQLQDRLGHRAVAQTAINDRDRKQGADIDALEALAARMVEAARSDAQATETLKLAAARSA